MSEILNIALVQTELTWENPEKNRADLAEKINAIVDPVDLIVLPEMFPTGFTMNPAHVAETMEGKSISWMKALAVKKQAAITGSMPIREAGQYYNRLIFAHPNGTIEHYDKRHTFTLAGEDKVYSAGDKKIMVNYKGWKICPLICYDLRFPVWSRNVHNYDLLIYVAVWPASRMAAWDALLKARAIENMSYCVGVNIVGKDGNQHDYAGHSAAYDVMGERIDTIPIGKETVEVVSLKKEVITKNRSQFNFLADQDCFSIA